MICFPFTILNLSCCVQVMSTASITSHAPSRVTALKPSETFGGDISSLERRNSNMDIDGLAPLLYIEQGVKLQQRLLSVLKNHPAFDKSGNYFDGRIERFKASVSRAKRLHQLQQMHSWSEDELAIAKSHRGQMVGWNVRCLRKLRNSNRTFDPQRSRLRTAPIPLPDQ